jgi:hypothetical protein
MASQSGRLYAARVRALAISDVGMCLCSKVSIGGEMGSCRFSKSRENSEYAECTH